MSDLLSRFLGTQSCAPQVGVDREDCSCRGDDGIEISDCPSCDGTGVVEVEAAVEQEPPPSCIYCSREHYVMAVIPSELFGTRRESRCEECHEELQAADERNAKRERRLAQEGWI